MVFRPSVMLVQSLVVRGVRRRPFRPNRPPEGDGDVSAAAGGRGERQMGLWHEAVTHKA